MERDRDSVDYLVGRSDRYPNGEKGELILSTLNSS